LLSESRRSHTSQLPRSAPHRHRCSSLCKEAWPKVSRGLPELQQAGQPAWHSSLAGHKMHDEQQCKSGVLRHSSRISSSSKISQCRVGAPKDAVWTAECVLSLPREGYLSFTHVIPDAIPEHACGCRRSPSCSPAQSYAGEVAKLQCHREGDWETATRSTNHMNTCISQYACWHAPVNIRLSHLWPGGCNDGCRLVMTVRDCRMHACEI
jgi:hypothetical protein